MRITMLTAGLVLLAAGLLLGTLSATATTTYGAETYSCGSPWFPDQNAISHQQTVNNVAGTLDQTGTMPTDDAAGLCGQAWGSRGVVGGVLAGLGALTLIGVGLLAAQRGRGEPTPPTTA